MNHFGTLDWCIVAAYFCGVAAIGPILARRSRSTEGYFLGDRAFPSWLLGFAMFATSISSVTVVASPGDAYKTAWLRLLPCFMLPVGVFIASRVFLPHFRRRRCTSAFEFLEERFGAGVRLYASIAFLIGQIMRISTILYLVSLVFEQITGASPYICIVAGGIVMGFYTVSGGLRAIVTAQFVQSFLLWTGAFLVLFIVVRSVDGGLATIIATGLHDAKISTSDLNMTTGRLEPSAWFSLQNKAILMMLLVGLNNWLTEYSSNQNVIQKYVAARDPREATRAIWICCLCSVPTWTFFMFLGTSLYVFFKMHPDAQAAAMLVGSGGAKAESILPFFCVHHIPSGVLGMVITGILSAAMSSSASSLNCISAVGVTDIYRRHIARERDDRHYVVVARVITASSALIMIGGAILFLQLSKLTLMDTGARLAAVLAGGMLGIYALGLLTRRGDGRCIGIGIGATVLFTTYALAGEMKWITPAMLERTLHMPAAAAALISHPMHTYYIGLFGNVVMFVAAYLASLKLRSVRTEDAPAEAVAG